LLPLVARNLLHGSAGFYGLLLGAVGAGAILGALVLPALRRMISADGLVLGAALVTAAIMALLSQAPPQPVAVAMLLILGAAWITALTTLNGTAQAILPNWVRGRGLAIYLTMFNGAMTGGSLAWGAVAEWIGIPHALLAGAGALALLGLIARLIPLPSSEDDLAPSNHWPEPLLAEAVAHDRGPVLITIEYQVRREDREAFLTLLHRLADERRRDGAYAWGITEDAAAPEHLVEWFMVESWAEHLRQHKRVSKADADIQREALQFHIGAESPRVSHFIGLQPGLP